MDKPTYWRGKDGAPIKAITMRDELNARQAFAQRLQLLGIRGAPDRRRDRCAAAANVREWTLSARHFYRLSVRAEQRGMYWMPYSSVVAAFWFSRMSYWSMKAARWELENT
jgi:hypothetical protein